MSDKNYMIQLDGLRAIAIGLVIFSHYTDVILPLAGFDHFLGAAGVTLFFVLSGFLITLILIGNRENQDQSNGFILKQFYIRRFLRIFPLYYLVILLGVLFNIPTSREHILALVTYTPNWLLGTESSNLRFFSHLWSLGVEEQFYIFFPLLFLLVSKKHIKTLFISLVIFAVVSRVAVIFLEYHLNQVDQTNWVAHRTTPCCLDPFGIGAMLAFLKFYYPEKTREWLKKSIWPVLSMLFLGIACFLWMADQHNPAISISNIIVNRTLISLASFWIIGVAGFSDFKGLQGKFLENRMIVYIGKISYGIYVYHFIIPHFFTSYAPFNSNALNIITSRILYVVVTLLIASTSWFLFEKPINDLKKYFSYSKHKSTRPFTAVAEVKVEGVV
jgi:peptidoglycan/LPS O-acetylase OafA/YrhL